MLLWIIFALLTSCVLFALALPVFRSEGRGLQSRSEFDQSVYQHQLSEIDAECERGVISKEEAHNARLEISRRLLAATDQPEQQASDTFTLSVSVRNQKSSYLFPAFILMSCLSVLTMGLYLKFGSPDFDKIALAQPPQTSTSSSSGQQQTQDLQEMSVQQLVARVEERLKQNPQDGTGWDVLAPVYLKMRRFSDAAHAYQQAIRIKGEAPGRVVGFAEALLWANGQQMTDQSRRAFLRALELDPKVHLARARLAGASEQEGKIEEALKLWHEIISHAGDAQDVRQWAEKNIDRLKNGTQSATDKTSSEQMTSKQTQAQKQAEDEKQGQTVKGPSEDDVKAAQAMSAEDRAAMIAGMVEGLAARLASQGGSIEEWMRLIRAYSVVGKKEQAGKALSDAKINLKDKPEDLKSLEAFATELGLAAH